jgi:hypothetical protein
MLNYDVLLEKKTPLSKVPAYVTKKQPYILEIENETRKYVLASKSQFDLEEWFTAIYAQIESLKANKYISKNASAIIQKERDMASKDLKILKHFHENRLSTNLLNQTV